MAITTVPFEQGVLDMSVATATNLSAKQFYAAKWSDDNPLTVALASAATDSPAGGIMIGNTSGNDVKVRIFGVGKAISGAAITAFGWVTVDSAGKFIDAAPGADINHNMWGIALGAVSNASEIFPLLFVPNRIMGT